MVVGGKVNYSNVRHKNDLYIAKVDRVEPSIRGRRCDVSRSRAKLTNSLYRNVCNTGKKTRSSKKTRQERFHFSHNKERYFIGKILIRRSPK